MDTTTLFGFRKPGARGTQPPVSDLRDAARFNADRLETVLQPLQHLIGNHADRPAAAAVLVGARWTSIDKGTEYQCRIVANNPTWVLIGAMPLEVTALPANPVDGQEVIFTAAGDSDVNNGEWHLRRRGGRWRFIGGAHLTAQNDNAYNYTADNNWQAVAPAVAVTVPFAGDYRVEWGDSGNYAHSVGVSIAGAAPVSPHAALGGPALTDRFGFRRFDGLAAGAVLALWNVSNVGGQTSTYNRRLSITPIRSAA